MSARTGQSSFDALWMPFTANRRFKARPRMLVSADGMYYQTPEGRPVLDGTAGLWCVNAGHRHRRVIEAVQRQVALLDYAPAFQMGHPVEFEAATKLAAILPADLDRIFFTTSGSDAVDTALKIAVAYHHARGETTRTRLIGRERGYHGVNFGGTSVGGIASNRRIFSSLQPAGIDHLSFTYDLGKHAFSRGQPEWGAHLANDLERIVALHDPSTIAAVIVEPLAASGGVLISPKGYLERLREISAKYGILLIFDEVITGFGRLGAAFAAEKFGITPDMITMAKGLTNGTIPMGAVAVRRHIHDAVLGAAPEGTIEFFHGYTYSGHPVAAAAASAAIDVYKDEGLFERAAELAPYFADAAHSLRNAKHVMDVRNLGLVAGIELKPRQDGVGIRGYETLVRCFEAGVLVRAMADTVGLSPPLIAGRKHIDDMFGMLREVLESIE